MVSIDCLAALDALLWLRTGRRAADQLGVSQPTISRNTRHCSELFNIRVVKKGGEWEVQGNHALLDAERRVHQRYRWDHHAPLRLDGHHRMADNLQGFQPAGWITGNLDDRDHARPLALLRSGIIDAWLCRDPDRPEDPSLSTWRLARSRAALVVRSEFAHHPRTASLIQQLLKHLPTVVEGVKDITVFDQALLCAPQASPAAPATAGVR